MKGIQSDVFEAVRSRVEATLTDAGYTADGRVWLKRVPKSLSVGYPRAVLRGQQRSAPQYDTLARAGVAFELEVGIYAQKATPVLTLTDALTPRLTDVDDPITIPGMNYLYATLQDTLNPLTPEAERSDRFGRIILVNLYYRSK